MTKEEIHLALDASTLDYNITEEIMNLLSDKTEQWQVLKETIIEMRDNDGTATQQDACKFLAELMDVLEKQKGE